MKYWIWLQEVLGPASDFAGKLLSEGISAEYVYNHRNDTSLLSKSAKKKALETDLEFGEEIIEKWESYEGAAQKLKLPSAPKQFLHYFTEDNRPQTKLDRNIENGMAVTIGRLRRDNQFTVKFVCMSHNTLRGAAGGAVLLAELLCEENYI